MERVRQGNPIEKPNHTKSYIIEEIPLETLLEVRKDSILSKETPISIFSDLGRDVEKFEILFHKPLKRDEFTKLIQDFTGVKFRPNYLSELWSGYEGGTNIYNNTVAGLVQLLQGENASMSVYGPQLGQILESEDDSRFLTSVVRGIKTHSESWRSVVADADFVQNLARMTIIKHSSLDGFDTEVSDFVNEFPGIPRIDKSRIQGHTKEVVTFENFAQQNNQLRADFISSVFEKKIGKNKNLMVFQRQIVDGMAGIRYTYNPEDSEPIYFVGEHDLVDIVQVKKDELIVAKNRFSASVSIENDGKVSIFPKQKNFMIPVFCFQNKNGERMIRMKSDVMNVKETISIPFKKGKVNVFYDVDDENVNPMSGLLVMYDLLLRGPQSQKVPPEAFPYVALKEVDSLLNKKFFEKIERVTE